MNFQNCNYERFLIGELTQCDEGHFCSRVCEEGSYLLDDGYTCVELNVESDNVPLSNGICVDTNENAIINNGQFTQLGIQNFCHIDEVYPYLSLDVQNTIPEIINGEISCKDGDIGGSCIQITVDNPIFYYGPDGSDPLNFTKIGKQNSPRLNSPNTSDNSKAYCCYTDKIDGKVLLDFTLGEEQAFLDEYCVENPLDDRKKLQNPCPDLTLFHYKGYYNTRSDGLIYCGGSGDIKLGENFLSAFSDENNPDYYYDTVNCNDEPNGEQNNFRSLTYPDAYFPLLCDGPDHSSDYIIRTGCSGELFVGESNSPYDGYNEIDTGVNNITYDVCYETSCFDDGTQPNCNNLASPNEGVNCFYRPENFEGPACNFNKSTFDLAVLAATRSAGDTMDYQYYQTFHNQRNICEYPEMTEGGTCDCFGNIIDECGICGGPGKTITCCDGTKACTELDCPICGCMDPNSFNYNPDAEVEVGCEYVGRNTDVSGIFTFKINRSQNINGFSNFYLDELSSRIPDDFDLLNDYENIFTKFKVETQKIIVVDGEEQIQEEQHMCEIDNSTICSYRLIEKPLITTDNQGVRSISFKFFIDLNNIQYGSVFKFTLFDHFLNYLNSGVIVPREDIHGQNFFITKPGEGRFELREEDEIDTSISGVNYYFGDETINFDFKLEGCADDGSLPSCDSDDGLIPFFNCYPNRPNVPQFDDLKLPACNYDDDVNFDDGSFCQYTNTFSCYVDCQHPKLTPTTILNDLSDEEIYQKVLDYNNNDFIDKQNKLPPFNSSPNDIFGLEDGDLPNNKILLTAPHAQFHCRSSGDSTGLPDPPAPDTRPDCKPPDVCTGGLIKFLGEYTGLPILYTQYKSDGCNSTHNLKDPPYMSSNFDFAGFYGEEIQQSPGQTYDGNQFINLQQGTAANASDTGTLCGGECYFLPQEDCNEELTDGLCRWSFEDTFEDFDSTHPHGICREVDPICKTYKTNIFDNMGDDIHPFKQQIREYLLDHPDIQIVLDLHGANSRNKFDVAIGVGPHSYVEQSKSWKYNNNFLQNEIGNYYNCPSDFYYDDNNGFDFFTDECGINDVFGTDQAEFINTSFGQKYLDSIIKKSFLKYDMLKIDYHNGSYNASPDTVARYVGEVLNREFTRKLDALQLEINARNRCDTGFDNATNVANMVRSLVELIYQINQLYDYESQYNIKYDFIDANYCSCAHVDYLPPNDLDLNCGIPYDAQPHFVSHELVYDDDYYNLLVNTEFEQNYESFLTDGNAITKRLSASCPDPQSSNYDENTLIEILDGCVYCVGLFHEDIEVSQNKFLNKIALPYDDLLFDIESNYLIISFYNFIITDEFEFEKLINKYIMVTNYEELSNQKFKIISAYSTEGIGRFKINVKPIDDNGEFIDLNTLGITDINYFEELNENNGYVDFEFSFFVNDTSKICSLIADPTITFCPSFCDTCTEPPELCCDGETLVCNAEQDCNIFVLDECGVCQGDNYEEFCTDYDYIITDSNGYCSVMDCNGVCNGGDVFDDCGDCGGDRYFVNEDGQPCQQYSPGCTLTNTDGHCNCNGDQFTLYYLDEDGDNEGCGTTPEPITLCPDQIGTGDYLPCGQIGGWCDNNIDQDCNCTNQTYDCNNVCGGSAAVDQCGICAGGLTNNTPNELIDGLIFGPNADDCGACDNDPNYPPTYFLLISSGEPCDPINHLTDGDCTFNGQVGNICNCDGDLYDCAGICGGDTVFDDCGVCGGTCLNPAEPGLSQPDGCFDCGCLNIEQHCLSQGLPTLAGEVADPLVIINGGPEIVGVYGNCYCEVIDNCGVVGGNNSSFPNGEPCGGCPIEEALNTNCNAIVENEELCIFPLDNTTIFNTVLPTYAGPPPTGGFYSIDDTNYVIFNQSIENGQYINTEEFLNNYYDNNFNNLFNTQLITLLEDNPDGVEINVDDGDPDFHIFYWQSGAQYGENGGQQINYPNIYIKGGVNVNLVGYVGVDESDFITIATNSFYTVEGLENYQEGFSTLDEALEVYPDLTPQDICGEFGCWENTDTISVNYNDDEEQLINLTNIFNSVDLGFFVINEWTVDFQTFKTARGYNIRTTKSGFIKWSE